MLFYICSVTLDGMKRPSVKTFQELILSWHQKHGRHELPWRRPADIRDPYRVLVSEVMLQQTQVDRVIPKYKSFLKKFPTPKALAGASTRALLTEWKGLGYNRRALFLRRSAEKITGELHGVFPSDEAGLHALPGVGEYTARAVSVFCFNRPMVFIETNIRRVFIHFFFHDRARVTDTEIIPLIQKTLWKKDPRLWYGALMDYGATAVKGIPNPNRRSAGYARQSKFEGSTRYARAKVLALFLRKRRVSPPDLKEYVTSDPLLKKYRGRPARMAILGTLERDGFLERHAGAWRIRKK
ncbi:MAG: hypothetical protein A3I44_05130 [Candidatus Sungbacteria bacterium RIFCSPLOWO2_02_FULL_51_17]|uniref:HhH-GPD domain-containing protein n=1 Tax=Candidatus Sungbacteria bacterium RIFCSPHIGHO2_02_FULL_51_29 TaxID=1802273 RepID=A0A1G2KQ56_9BACT|nr:MAG: hypothetical protein A2676_05140 [Candidatus Sungbacteria bacterium RIFCSPHIGHO2_01_FULL_51_22]OHA01546.1 MAG: hypothetical protein A3C16_05235 [Candidatus Sungbacteria bacterium RIFCSPHIGHO2_02_FULL_51_29]OHA07027.1 MAG: hypothetical protein A3B29_01200 [Candidatus Sungbacteria bacterium RIFCSPLOWO2_01_FULL_51_34]OHA11800.1 MAG: hypothetical protein A3I44_05130 [Candidatus Sungbacteria bacterium RIFCSPLOWO2_02_FULL_51_17]